MDVHIHVQMHTTLSLYCCALHFGLERVPVEIKGSLTVGCLNKSWCDYTIQCQTTTKEDVGLYLLTCVLVCWGCCDKAPQTKQLQTTESYSLPVLEAGSLKSRCPSAMLSLKPLGEDPSRPLPACGGGLQHHFNLFLCLHVAFSLCISLPLLKRQS